MKHITNKPLFDMICIIYIIYIYIMYIMSVSENGAYTAYRKKKTKKHGWPLKSGQWEHDKTIGSLEYPY